MDAGACSCPERLQLDGKTQLMGKDRESFGFAVFTGKSFEMPFGWLVAFEEKHGGFREGPLKVSVTDLFASGSVFFAVGFFDAFDQTAVGDKILDRGEAFDGFDLVENDQSEDSSDSGDGLKQGVGS